MNEKTRRFGFKKPPVVELVMGLGLEDNCLSSLDIYNIFQSIKTDYPVIEEYNALTSIIENTSGPTSYIQPQLNSFRKQFIGQNEDKLLQLQNNRIIFNWRKFTTQSPVDYPKFEPVQEEFYKLIERVKGVKDFMGSIIQQEITFYDHINLNDLFLSADQMQNALSIFNFNYPSKYLQFSLLYNKPELNGVLTFNCSSASSIDNNDPILVLETTIRGFQGNTLTDIKDWFNTSHDHLVEFFVEILSEHTKEKLGFSIN